MRSIFNLRCILFLHEMHFTTRFLFEMMSLFNTLSFSNIKSLLTKGCSASKGYTRLHGATVHRVTWGYTGLRKATQGYKRLYRVTWGYTGLHKATQGYERLHRVTWGYTGLHKATQGYERLHRVTWGYTGLHKAIQGYIRLHRVTWGYTGLHKGYKRLYTGLHGVT